MYSLYMDCAGGVRGDKRILRDLHSLLRFYSFHTIRQEVGNVPPCINSTAQTSWLNRPDVRKALHIPPTLPTWELCSDQVAERYVREYQTMESFYLKLLGGGLRGLVYNGDTDMACNFMGDQWFVQSLNLKKTREYQMWIYKKQIAGFYEQFGNLTFLTVKGAGHMVPQEAPGPAFHMFKSFLTNSDY
uniref:Lysosomal protective protein-like protein n=1 Tax=Callorhinchus milii TaxID=7868 RepID=V9KJ39_CALMI